MRRAFERVLASLNICASVALVGLMLMICADVAGRSFFNAPLVGVPEIVKMSIVAIFWMQVAFALNAGQHLRSNLLFAAFPRGFKRVVWAANCLAGIAVFALIVWYSLDNLASAWSRGEFEGEHPVRIPVWPVWFILILGAFLTALEYARQLVVTVRNGTLDVLQEGDPVRGGDRAELVRTRRDA